MVTSTTTIRQTTTMSGVFAADSDKNDLFSFMSLYNAYIACRRRKRSTINALGFEADMLENLFSLKESLENGSYQPGRSVCFVTRNPKPREIFAADFSDRVIHHLLVPELEKIFEPKFIYDSYACRKNKGSHAAVKRLISFMNGATAGGKVPAWFMQLDIKSFFMSINKDILLKIIEKHTKRENIINLVRVIIKHDNTKNYIYKGDPGLLEKIPQHKTLFYTPEHKGLPTGNLTSRFFANVYLNELDQYVKHVLKVRYYIRYVDDLILLDRSKDRLLDSKRDIELFLKQKIDLEFRKDHGQTVKRVSGGADFLGYIVRPKYVLVRNRVVGNLKSRLQWFFDKVVENGAIARNKYVRIHLRDEPIHALRQVLASYMGHFKHANAYNPTKNLFKRYNYLEYLFSLDSGYKLTPLYETPFIPANLKQQYRWYGERYKKYFIFFQVGRFFEFYGKQADLWIKCFGTKLCKERRGMGKQSGFPVRLLRAYKREALLAGHPYIVIGERGYYASGLKKRVITEMLIFPGSEQASPVCQV